MKKENQINEGGAAFPHVISEGFEEGDFGMTLRQYFAAHAPEKIPENFCSKENDKLLRLIRWHYFYADCMIANSDFRVDLMVID